eukprot:6510413-Alexandrium_andersonii.AAC.1
MARNETPGDPAVARGRSPCSRACRKVCPDTRSWSAARNRRAARGLDEVADAGHLEEVLGLVAA